MTAKLHQIDPATDRAAEVRRILGRSVRAALEDLGADLRGFALVSWDHRGNTHASSFTMEGPVSSSLMPTFVGDVLNRHVAVSIAKGDGPGIITGEP